MTNKNSEELTVRLLLAHWPDDSYILRGVAAQWGEEAATEVKESLDRRRAVLMAEAGELVPEKRTD